MELRHTGRYNNAAVADQLYLLLEEHRVMNIIADTTGRRDLLHMRLTTPSALPRYAGTNKANNDRSRPGEQVERLKTWVDPGIEDIRFFAHQSHK